MFGMEEIVLKHGGLSFLGGFGWPPVQEALAVDLLCTDRGSTGSSLRSLPSSVFYEVYPQTSTQESEIKRSTSENSEAFGGFHSLLRTRWYD